MPCAGTQSACGIVSLGLFGRGSPLGIRMPWRPNGASRSSFKTAATYRPLGGTGVNLGLASSGRHDGLGDHLVTLRVLEHPWGPT